MQKIGEQMRGYQNSPELKVAQKRLKEASKKLQDYMKSPAFKQKMKLYRDKMDMQFDFHYDTDDKEDLKTDTAKN